MGKSPWTTFGEERHSDSGHRSQGPFEPLAVGAPPERSIVQAIFPELMTGRSAAADETARVLQIVRTAEREAQGLIEAARQKAVVTTQEAYREGRLQGHAEAVEEARAQFQQLTTALEAAMRRLRTLEEQFRAQAGQSIVHLALAVAERICRTQMLQDPEATLRAVQAALALLPEAGDITIRIHPDQLSKLEEHRAELLGQLGGRGDLRFVSDPSVEAGGCQVETVGCLAENTLTAQLDEARRRLLGEPW